jgi:hypothetical protein
LWGCIPAAARKRAGDGTTSGVEDDAVGLADKVKGTGVDADLEGGSRVSDRLIAVTEKLVVTSQSRSTGSPAKRRRGL